MPLPGMTAVGSSRWVCGTEFDMQGVHFSVCPNEGGVIARHDNVCHDVSSMNHAALMSNKREVLYTDDSAHRADILLDEGCDGNPTILDVNVTEPLCATHLASQVPPLTAAHNAKMRDHLDTVSRSGHAFLPIVMHTLGGVHAGTKRWFGDTAKIAGDRRSIPASWFFGFWRAAVVFTLHRAVARQTIDHLASLANNAARRSRASTNFNRALSGDAPACSARRGRL